MTDPTASTNYAVKAPAPATWKAVLRGGGLPLALLLLGVLVFKVLFQIGYQANNPLSRQPVSDEAQYIQMAGEISGGKLSPGEVFHVAPLYPYILTPVLAFADGDPFAARLFQALLGTASVLLLYIMARCFFPRNWALCAAAASALYYPFTFFEGKLLITTSAVFFLHLGLVWMIGGGRGPRIAAALAAGAAVGIAAALRPNLLLFAPPAALWFYLAFRHRQGFLKGLIFLVGVAIPVLPFTLHNYMVGDDLVLLSDNGGINFYLGNNPSARGSFHNIDPAWGEIRSQFDTARSRAEAAVGHPLKPSEVSRYWLHEGMAFAADRPLRYLGLLLEKLKSLLENFEYAIIYAPGAERSLTQILYIAFLPYGLFVAGAVLGSWALWIEWRRRRKQGVEAAGEGSGRAAWWLLWIVIAATLLSVLLFFNYSRFRLIAVPSLIILSIQGCREWLGWLRAGRKTACLAGLGLFSAGLAVSLIPYGDQWRRQTAHGLGTVGGAFQREGDFASAEAWFTRALQAKPDMILLLTERGVNRVRLGDYDGARKDLEEAVRLAPGYGPVLADLAGFYARKTPYRDTNRALDLIGEAASMPTATPSEMAKVRMVEGNVRMERREFRAAAKAYEASFALERDPPDALFFAGLAYREGGETQKARACFEKVLEIDPNHAGAAAELARIPK